MTTSIRKRILEPVIPKNSSRFPIVGIGASAGWLDAFKKLLKHIPEKSGMAYVLVQHLDPKHESVLPEILERVTNIPVFEITNDIKLAPDHIYIMPSAHILTAEDGVLCLRPREKFKPNLPINVFFQSLAEVHKKYAYGVVLSGTGSDGTIGLEAIKENGGGTIAQNLEYAGFPAMPQNAIEAKTVDYIFTPEEIPGELVKIFKKRSLVANKDKKEIPSEFDEPFYKEILSILNQQSGIEFTYYKQSTIRRRIAHRMALCNNELPQAFTTFHYSLKPTGYLLLGKSESTNAASELFKTLDKHHKIYEPNDVESRFKHLGIMRTN